MGLVIRPREIESALNRLTGHTGPWRQTNESCEWRLLVKSRDGEHVAIRIQVGMHRKEVAKASFGQIARRLLIDRKIIHDVLSEWTHEQLVGHLESFTAQELKEPMFQMFRR